MVQVEAVLQVEVKVVVALMAVSTLMILPKLVEIHEIYHLQLQYPLQMLPFRLSPMQPPNRLKIYNNKMVKILPAPLNLHQPILGDGRVPDLILLSLMGQE